jgi:hypothetical protein
VGERHVFSPAIVNQFTASFSRPITWETQPETHPALQIFTPARYDAYVGVPDVTALGASFVTPFQYQQNKFTEKDDLTWIKGSHTLRIGGMFQRQQLNPNVLVFWNGFYIFQSGVAGCASAAQCFLEGNPFLLEGAPNGGTNGYRSERYDAVQLFSGRLEGYQQADNQYWSALRLGNQPHRGSQSFQQRCGATLPAQFRKCPARLPEQSGGYELRSAGGSGVGRFWRPQDFAARGVRDFSRSVYDIRFLVVLCVIPAV